MEDEESMALPDMSLPGQPEVVGSEQRTVPEPALRAEVSESAEGGESVPVRPLDEEGAVEEGATEPLKWCNRCKSNKPISQFFKAIKGKYLKSGYCKLCSKAYKAERYADVQSIYDKAKRDHLKAEFLAAYGNKCECCGESEPDFLTVDHKNNDGEAHRKSVSPSKRRGGNTSEVLRVLRKEGWPDYVRILCFNCNFGRRARPGGICPHKRNLGASA